MLAPLDLRDVWKTYDQKDWVLRGASLQVRAGEVVVLMGPSGSGKTTLLNLVAGIETADRGEVLVAGADLGKLEEDELANVRLRHVGLVFQQYHLIPELTLAENVQLPMRFARRADMKARSDHLLRFFGIQDKAKAFPATLSGGQAQRAAIARALANEPAILLADEPTANLDEKNAATALRELRRVADELGTAVLVATHDPTVRPIGDRVVRIADGQVAPEPGAPTPRRDAAGASATTPPRRPSTPSSRGRSSSA